MTSLAPYTPQITSYTCSTWSGFNSYIATPIQWGLDTAGVVTAVLNRVGVALDYMGHNQMNERMQRSASVALVTNVFVMGGINIFSWASSYFQASSCSQYELEFQNKKSEISVKLIQLVKAAQNNEGKLTDLQSKPYAWIHDNYELIYEELAHSKSSNAFISAAANMLKKYFPNENRLDSIALLDMKQIKVYFEIVAKKSLNEEIKLTSSEKQLLHLWNVIFEYIN